MNQKQKLDNDELNQVNGGTIERDNDFITCKCCQNKFYFGDATKKEIKDGCGSETVYQCPHCHTWVTYKGEKYTG